METDNIFKNMDPDMGSDNTERNKRIMRLYVQGKTQKHIAGVVNLTRQRVSQIIKDVRAAWKVNYSSDFNLMINEQLAKIDAVEEELWAAWERSKQFRRHLINKAGVEKGEKTSTLQEEYDVDEGMNVIPPEGNPKFLQQIQNCIDQRSKFLGLYSSEVRQAEKEEKQQQWRDELVKSLQEGTMTPETVKMAFPNIANQLMMEAGLDITEM